MWPNLYLNESVKCLSMKLKSLHLRRAINPMVSKCKASTQLNEFVLLNCYLPTSPPKAAMLSFTHCNAAIWSNNPKLLAVWSLVPGWRKPKTFNPNVKFVQVNHFTPNIHLSYTVSYALALVFNFFKDTQFTEAIYFLISSVVRMNWCIFQSKFSSWLLLYKLLIKLLV